MAGEVWLTAQDLRIVLLAKTGTAKTKLARAILRNEELVGASEQCVLHEDIQAGRKICLVNTPGWDTVSIDCTSQNIKNEISRSVTFCAPGPHAVILVFPVHDGDAPPQNELKAAIQHMELLSERVWNHTMVLFLCDQDVDQSTVNKHIENAEKLLEKCRGRHHVLRGSVNSETQIHELFKKIDDMVEGNCGDYFLPQVYYEVIKKKSTQDINDLRKKYEDREEHLKQLHQKTLNQLEKEKKDASRRGSMSKTRPDLNEAGWNLNKPAVVIGVAVIGALIGSVVGSEYGTPGAGLGILIGVFATIPISLKLIDALKVVTSPTAKDTQK